MNVLGIIKSAFSTAPKAPPTFQDKINKFCHKEAKLINGIFDARNLRGVYIESISASDIAGYIRYHVQRPHHVEVSKITKLRSDIAATLTASRVGDNDVTVDINPTRMVIEVEYPWERAPLGWDIVPINSMKPMDIVLGRCYEGSSARPMTINLYDKSVSNIGVFALPGSGKTQAVLQMIASSSFVTSPGDLKFIMLDPKFSPELAELAGVEHVEWITEPSDCQQMVFNIKAELDRRKRNPDKRKIVLVIDELAEFFRENEDGDVILALRSIASLGRQLNVHIIAATQYPTVKATDSELRAMIPIRLGGHVNDEVESRVAMGVGGVGCEFLPMRGAFFLRDLDSKIKRINTHFLPEDDIHHWVERVNYKWRAKNSWQLEHADKPVATSGSSAVKADAVTPDQIDLILETYDIESILTAEGKIRRGMGATLIRLVFGDDANVKSGTYMRWQKSLPSAFANL